MHCALQRICGAKYFVHKLHKCQLARVSLEVCSLSRKKIQTSCSTEEPQMSGSHLGIRFEVPAKLAGTRGSKTPNFETSRVTYGRLPM